MKQKESSLDLWGAYRIQLLVLFDQYNAQVPKPDAKIEALLNPAGQPPPQSWESLYEAEQRLVQSHPDDKIKAAAAARFVEAERLGVTSVAAMREEFTKAATPEARKAVFAILLDDLHFRYAKRRLDRKVRKLAAKRLNSWGLVIVLLHLCLLATFLINSDYIAKAHVLAGMLFGVLGAYFSRLIAFQTAVATLDYDLIEQDYSNWSVIVRLFIGAIGALVLYFLVSADLLGGSMFPTKDFAKFTREVALTDGAILIPSSDLAKLMIWSFLFGFSERLLPDQLGRVEASAKAMK